MNEYEIKSEEVLKILEKYRDKLRLERFYLKFNENWNKRYVFRVIFKCDFKKYDFETIHDGELTIDFTKGENIIKFGNWSSGSGLVYKDLSKLKLLIKMAEELQKIDFLKLDEFKTYIALKDKQKELEEERKKLEEELLKQKEEIENKLKSLEGKSE